MYFQQLQRYIKNTKDAHTKHSPQAVKNRARIALHSHTRKSYSSKTMRKTAKNIYEAFARSALVPILDFSTFALQSCRAAFWWCASVGFYVYTHHHQTTRTHTRHLCNHHRFWAPVAFARHYLLPFRFVCWCYAITATIPLQLLLLLLRTKWKW